MATIKDKITLAMLPSAQSGGVSTSTSDYSGTVYSLLPIQHESPNLVVNGGFDQDSDWTKGTGWSISGGKAILDGTQTSFSNLQQNNLTEEGKTYKVTVDVVSMSGTIELKGNTVYKRIDELGVGTHTFYITADRTYFRFLAFSGATATINSVSVQLVSNGDFDFERSSSATRVGSDGYIKNVEVISDELVQNGDFEQIGSELLTNGNFEDGENGWNTGAGNFDIVNGKAVINHTNDTSVVVQNNVATVGKIYRVEFTISDYSEGRIRLRYPFINGDLENNPRNGTFVYYGEATDHRFELQSRFTEDANYKVDNISVKEVGQNWNFTNATINNGEVVLSPSANLNQNCGLINGKTYRINYDITSISAGSSGITAYAGSTGAGTIRTEVGTYTEYIVASGVLSLYFFTGGGFVSGTIDNISVKEVTRDTDIPRLDFSNSAQPCLLLEPQRTNLVTYSKDFNFIFTTHRSTLTANQGVSPEGLNNAVKFAEDTTLSNTHFIGDGYNYTSGVSYSWSVFVKADGRSKLKIQQGNIAVISFNADFDLANGTAVNYGNGTATIKDFGNGWYRCSIENTIALSTASTNINIFLIDGSSLSYSGDGTSGVLLYGLQLEEGSFATSYIPTNGETNGVTRNKDKADNAGDNIIFNDEEGVLYAEIAALANSGSDRVFAIHNSSNTQEYINLRIDELANRFQMVVRSGGANSTTRGINVTNSLEFNKVAVRYKQGESFRIFANGDFEDDTSSTGDPTPNGLNEMFFSANFEGKVRSILYFDKALTNEELIHLTSSDITQVLRNYNRRGELLGVTYESAHVQTKLNELF